MPSIPKEFSPEHIQANTANTSPEQRLYETFWNSRQPQRSFQDRGRHASAKDGFSINRKHVQAHLATDGLDLDDDDLYYNTQGTAREYWAKFDLPKPTKDIHRLRRDLAEWGYCLIEEALSKEQHERMHTRLYEQIEGERLAGVADFGKGVALPGQQFAHKTQYVHQLLNKGLQFRQCAEHDPAGVQAGPLIERLLTEAVGPGFLCQSFLAITAYRNAMPQALHQDFGLGSLQEIKTPVTCNTMYIVDDMNWENGSTLVVPGSHRLVAGAGSASPSPPLPPAINVEAPGGTVMLFEGRLLHGTGVNRTSRPRTVAVMNSTPVWYRQQELQMLSADPSWLATASPKLLQRICGTGGHGHALGWIEGATGYLVSQRLAMERGEYVRIGELSPRSSVEELTKDYTFRHADNARQMYASGVYDDLAAPEVKAKYGRAPGTILWEPPGRMPSLSGFQWKKGSAKRSRL